MRNEFEREKRGFDCELAEEVFNALRTVPHGIAVFDRDDKVVFASDTYRGGFEQAFTGLPDDPLIDGPDFAKILTEAILPHVDPEDRAAAFAKEMQAHRKGDGFHSDVKSRRGWRRRFKYRLSSGHTIALGFPIDTLMQEQARLEQARNDLQYQALHDALTGLPNRRGLNAHLRDRLDAGGVPGEAIAVLHVDLDKFKAVNDTFGHHAGDKVLTQAAKILRDNVRADDIVARVGGDEFILLCDGFKTTEDISTMAQRIVDKMHEPISYSDDYCQIGASIGIAIASPGISIVQLIQDADVALYRAKENGRGQFAYFTPALRANYSAKQARVGAVSDAFHLNAFEPFLQPIIAGNSGAVTGLHVCPRWNHIEWGPVGPERFNREIGEANLSRDLDQRMFERCIRQLRLWAEEDWEAPRLHLTFSAETLLDEETPARILNALDRARVGRNSIAIGISEAETSAEQRDNLIDALGQLKAGGVHVFLDQFGNGSTSIPALRSLPLDQITLSPAFWGEVEADAGIAAILSAITTFAGSLDIDVQADAVETEGQRSRLLSVGINGVKGSAIGKPMRADAVRAWIGIYAESLVQVPRAEAS